MQYHVYRLAFVLLISLVLPVAVFSYITEEAEFRQYGAGMPDVYSAMNIISSGDHVQGTINASQTSIIYSRTVNDTDTILRVAFTYSITIEYSGATHSGNLSEGTIGELTPVYMEQEAIQQS